MADKKSKTQQAVEQAEDAVFEKGLPCDVDAERLVLGSTMIGSVDFSIVTVALEANDFSLEAHRRIYARMVDIVYRGDKVDRITLSSELVKNGQLESIGGLTYLVDLDKGLPEVINVESYIRIVKETSRLRQLIFDAQRRIDQAMLRVESVQIISQSVSTLSNLQRQEETADKGRSPEEIVSEFPGGIPAFLDPTMRARGLPTGFTKFDELTNGLHAGELTIVAARPGMGKSSWLLNVIAHLCLHPKQRRRVSLFSLEMSASSLLTRLMCADARVDMHKFRSGYLNAEERRRLHIGLDNIMNCGLRIHDKFGIGLAEFEACARADVDSGCCLIGIDYLQLMGVKKGENRNLEVSTISRKLKLLSGPTECNVPIIAVSQLSRANEKRSGASMKPMLSDLRDSGSLEQDADNVHFIDREEVYKKDREDLRGLAEIIIGKQRNGPQGVVPLRFIGAFTRFENRSEDLDMGAEETMPGRYVD